MKRYNRRYFTLIELMFVVFILAVLIGVSWVAGTKTLRKQAQSKTKAEITMLVSAVKQYYDRYGLYPERSGNVVDFNFGQYLSKVEPKSDSDWEGIRPMFIDFRKHGIDVNNDEYDLPSATTTVVLDPYGNKYQYQYEAADIDDGEYGTFKIWSIGLDSDDPSDDISSENLNK